MNENNKKDQQVSTPVDYESESIIDYGELIADRVFLGEYPYHEIVNRIKTQFNDYINMEDTTNYVDIYYQQMWLSCDRVNEDDSETHPQEIRDILTSIKNHFINTMRQLIKDRLNISIFNIEEYGINSEELQFIFRRIYDFFILGARDNFKAFIASDVSNSLNNITDENYMEHLKIVMQKYALSPYSNLTTDQFLRHIGNPDMIELFERGWVSGNFLVKYSPKFYNNLDFLDEVSDYIRMIRIVRKENIYGGINNGNNPKTPGN
jgi:hypothetical protein